MCVKHSKGYDFDIFTTWLAKAEYSRGLRVEFYYYTFLVFFKHPEDYYIRSNLTNTSPVEKKKH